MTQVILNGKRVGTITHGNLDILLRNTTFTVVSRTATTVNLEG